MKFTLPPQPPSGSPPNPEPSSAPPNAAQPSPPPASSAPANPYPPTATPPSPFPPIAASPTPPNQQPWSQYPPGQYPPSQYSPGQYPPYQPYYGYPPSSFQRPPEPPLPAAPLPPLKPISSWLWLAIGLITASIVGLQVLASQLPEKPVVRDGVELPVLMFRMQSRYLVGLKHLVPAGDPAQQQVLPQARETLDRGKPDQRIRFVILVGELGGRAAAREQIADLQQQFADEKVELSKPEKELLARLGRLYSEAGDTKSADAKSADAKSAKPALSADEREAMRSELGWLGRLAVSHDKPLDATADAADRRGVEQAAVRTVAVLILVVLGLLGAGMIGTVLLAVYGMNWLNGSLRMRFAPDSQHGPVYAETFALWMLMFAGLQVLAALLKVPELGLLPSGAAMLLSMSALLWPMIRGLSWSQVRDDLGLHFGESPLLEPIYGVGAWMMALPMLGVGVVVMLLMMVVVGLFMSQTGQVPAPDPDAAPGEGLPAHPIVGLVAGGDPWTIVQVLILASVLAPITEEIMFRGVLYRCLRETSWGVTRYLGVAFSTAVSGFVFAIIHPQGPLAVPVLMALATGFTLVRECRGTLVPSMVAHALNNTLVFALMIAIVVE